MPILRARLDGVRFLVYGSSVPDAIRELGSEDVIIKGYVEDIGEVYNRCRVFVVPLLVGAGLKGKVLDALAHGTPSVLSPIAAEGINLSHGSEALIAETPEEWATAVARLYLDDELWRNMSKAAQSVARTNYSFERGRKVMRRALEAADFFVGDDDQALFVNRAKIAPS